MKIGIIGQSINGFLAGKRYIVNSGGTRSGKTFAILEALYHIATTQKELISVVSETFPHLRKGAIRDFQLILENMGVWDANAWSKSESTYTLSNGSIIEFFSVDSPSKVHGPARSILFINEGQNISYEIVRHLLVRTTGSVFIDFNPTHEFWAHKELQSNEDTFWIDSTYKDNPHLTSQQIKEIERGRSNAAWWTVYGEGKIGRMEGLIFPDFTQVDDMPQPAQWFGLDFGYTNDPTALIGVCIIGNDLYLDEWIYQTGLRNTDILRLASVPTTSRPIYADSAEPKTIDDLYLGGLNIHPVIKGKDSVQWGLDLMRNFKIHVTKRSTGLIKELRNYTYAKDKEGNALNQPIDAWNHSIDAARYAVSMVQRSKHEYQQHTETYSEMEL